jgi:hypothetical protein
MPIDHPHAEDDGRLLARVRETLREKPEGDRHWAALGAAAVFALCAMVFAAAAVLAPPLAHDPAAKVGVK